jgi:hypothetical protein
MHGSAAENRGKNAAKNPRKIRSERKPNEESGEARHVLPSELDATVARQTDSRRRRKEP